MSEILYTGLPSIDKMQQIVAACHFDPEALFLGEQLPTHRIVTREERYALLRFSYAKEGTPCTEYTSGRIFQADRELRWEKQRDQIRVIYLGPVENDIAGILEEYGLKSKQETLNALTKSTEPTWYSLFGERIKSADLPYFGKTAQPGDFAVVRIPRVLRYPVATNDEPSARLLVCEYHNKKTDSVDLFRFQTVEAWNDRERGEKCMNPYDFARIDWKRAPERRRPIWHHRLIGEGGQRLYTGHIEGDIYVETPFFISDPRSSSPDPRRAAQSIKNSQGEYIIPGSSLKGMIRSVVETLGNGCLTLFDGSYERGRVNYKGGEAPKEFQHCSDNTKLCIACRTFGMLKERAQGIFLGKVNIGDACTYSDKIYLYDPIYTLALMEPKPHHASFYLDEERQYIAGRKFYFHHSPDQRPVTENKIIMMNGRPANRYIQPLDRDTQFHMRIDFTNLEADEFGALLLAVTLEKEMRHKIGYGKPMGLGSINLVPTQIKLIDYAARYTRTGNTGGISIHEGETLWPFIDGQLDTFYEKYLLQIAMDDLRRIWRWPPDPDVEYYYPSKRDWFDTEESIGKRIADTKKVP